MEQRTVKIGQVVTYIAPDRTEHDALVTHIWGPEIYPDAGGQKPGINLVFVSANPDREDTCGRQIERNTSVVHFDMQPAGACCWREK